MTDRLMRDVKTPTLPSLQLAGYRREVVVFYTGTDHAERRKSAKATRFMCGPWIPLISLLINNSPQSCNRRSILDLDPHRV
jgi:hypothetical protein